MLLGMTVTLFSAIFVFVNRFPTPAAQGTGQFQAYLVLSPSGSSAVGLRILHGSGPAVPSNGKVYISVSGAAATNTGDYQFVNPNPIGNCLNVSNYATSSWTAGQAWYTNFTTGAPPPPGCFQGTSAPVNLPATFVVSVIVGGTLLFNVVIPASTTIQPPVVVQVWTSNPVPTASQAGQPGWPTSFYVNATILYLGASSGSVVALTGGVPGMNPSVKLTFLGSNLWSAQISTNLPSKTGPYTAFLQASNTLSGQSSSATFTINVT